MTLTIATEKKKKTSFVFSLAKTPEYIRRDNKKEKGKIHYLVKKDKVIDKRVKSGYHLQQILFNTDFRFGHDGLNFIAKRVGINLVDLPQGNVVVFFNTARTAMKIAFSDRGIFHHRESTKIEVRMIPEIMKQLNSTGKVDCPKALEGFLTAAIGGSLN